VSRTLYLLLLLVLAGLASPLALPAAAAQSVETPVLGEPVEVTPIWTTAPDGQPADETPEPTSAAAPGRSSPVSSSPASTASALPIAAEPDGCEPNNQPDQPCPLPLDAISGPFTFVPDSDADFFLLDLPVEAAIETAITARTTDGLDLVLSARQGPTLLASGALSLTLAPAISGTVLLRVENRDPRPAIGEQYRLEVRRTIAPRPTPDQEAPLPDVLENNWGPATAAQIAVGEAYDLSFVCPEARPDACPGGDHDYLHVPVKADVPYLFATWDLDPGVDPVLELFWGGDERAVAANDDYGPGGMLAALRWTAPADGLLLARVAPRNGGAAPRLAAPSPARYRFAVAPTASELAAKLDAIIREQANLPTPTVQPTRSAPPDVGEGGGGAPAAPPASGGVVATAETIATGEAIVVAETVLRREPSEGSTALATLAPESIVSVRGPVRGLWVSVESDASLLPGWVRFSDLRRVGDGGGGTSPTPAGAGTVAPSQQPGAATEPVLSPTTTVMVSANGTPRRAVEVVARELDPALPEPPPSPVAPVPFALSIVVVASDRPPTGSSTLGFATPTPDLRRPIARVRVQLVTVFGDLLAEGLSDASGAVQLRSDIRPGHELHVRLPAWGVELPLAPEQASLVLAAPEATE
jgi:hypothetical protein